MSSGDVEPRPRRATAVILQVIAAVIVVEIGFQARAEVVANGWTAAAWGMIALALVIVGAVVYAARRR